MEKIHLFWLLVLFAFAIDITRHLIFGIASIHFIYLFTGFLILILVILAAYIMYKIYLEKKELAKNNKKKNINV